MNEQTLINEYEAWLRANNIEAGCAFELLSEDYITTAQRKWLTDFIARWDAVV